MTFGDGAGYQPHRRTKPRLFCRAARCLLSREYALVNRAGLSNEASSLELRFRDKSYNFAHVGTKASKTFPPTVGFGPSEFEDVRPSQEVISEPVGHCEKITSEIGAWREFSEFYQSLIGAKNA